MPQFRLRVNPLAPSKSGYFILSFKTEKIKVVNADSAEISLLNQIIRRHTRIRSEGWERHMTWAFHLGESPIELLTNLREDFTVRLHNEDLQGYI